RFVVYPLPGHDRALRSWLRAFPPVVHSSATPRKHRRLALTKAFRGPEYRLVDLVSDESDGPFPGQFQLRQMNRLLLVEPVDLVRGEADLAQDRAAMLAEGGSGAAGLGLARAPARRHLHLPDASLHRVFDRPEEADRVEMRIIENA